MALICCINRECYQSYPETLTHCPNCNTYNSFGDHDTMLPTVNVFIEQIKDDKKEKLRELNKHLPQSKVKRLWRWIWKNI